MPFDRVKQASNTIQYRRLSRFLTEKYKFEDSGIVKCLRDWVCLQIDLGCSFNTIKTQRQNLMGILQRGRKTMSFSLFNITFENKLVEGHFLALLGFNQDNFYLHKLNVHSVWISSIRYKYRKYYFLPKLFLCTEIKGMLFNQIWLYLMNSLCLIYFWLVKIFSLHLNTVSLC